MSKLVFVYDPRGAPLEEMRMIVPKGMPFEFFDPGVQYPSDTVFYYNLYGPGHDTIPRHLQQGYRVIFDAKNEHYIHYGLHHILYGFMQHPGQGCFIISGHEPDPLPGVKIIATPYWYWVLDQTQMTTTGVNSIVWQASNTKQKFFMSLGQQRKERDYLFNSLSQELTGSLYSYRARGITLPNDDTHSPRWQRYLNPDWMHVTAFTIAVESFVDETATSGYSLTRSNNLFLTEKSYKPIAAQHPILMVSTQGNLAYLRSQGFETFPELFDESYDNIPDWQQRIDHVVQQVTCFDCVSVDQPRVLEKLRHNQNRFFDRSVTNELAYTTIQQPLFEFING